jgi:hypothetical protein
MEVVRKKLILKRFFSKFLYIYIKQTNNMKGTLFSADFALSSDNELKLIEINILIIMIIINE